MNAERDASSAQPSATASPAPATPARAWIARVALVLVSVVAWGRTLTQPLVRSWDDGHFLDPSVNPTLTPSLDAFVSAWTEIHFDAYQPLHLLSYWIDVPLFGPSGPVVHGTNLLFWIAIVLLLARLFERLGLSLAAASVAAALFAAHPSAMEIVGWGTGRKDLVALLFSMLAMHAHLDAKGPWDGAAWRSRLFFLLAMLGKTASMPLPFALFAIDVWCGRRAPRQAAVQQAPTLAIAALLGGLVLWIWHSHDLIRGTGSDATQIAWVLIPATLTHYLHVAFFPDALSPMYAFERDVPSTTLDVVLGPAIFALALLFAWRIREKSQVHALFGAGLLVALLYLAPVSNLVPLYFQWADRYLVWMLLGLVLAVGALLELLFAGAGDGAARRVGLVGGVLVLALTARSVQYAEVWSSDLRLWGHAVTMQPRSYYAWMKLGEVHRDGRHFGPALDAYAHAIEIAPDLRLGHAAFAYTLGLRDESQHDLTPSRALEHSERFLRRMDDAEALRDLAADMADQGYRRAMTYVLARSFDLEPPREDQLEHAVAVQLRNGNLWLARFYLSRMRQRPLSALVNSFWRREQAIHDRTHGRSAPDGDEASPADAAPLNDVGLDEQDPGTLR